MDRKDRIFEGKIIFSDVDGTLISEKGELPESNIQAINYFVKNGGRFTLATGRGYQASEKYIKQLPINAPCVFWNGGEIYDINEKKVLSRSFIPKQSQELIEEIIDKFQQTTCIVCFENGYNIVTEEREGDQYLHVERELINKLDLSTNKESICKALFLIGDKDYEEFINYTKQLQRNDIKVVFSGRNTAEVIPVDSTKANGIKKVVELYGIEEQEIIAIGDYFNDYEMLEQAAISASVKNGHPDIKAIADIVCCHCDEGAIKELVAYVERLAV